MWQATVCTSWIGTGAEDDANRPNLGDEYKLAKWEDVTGTPAANLAPDPNLYIVRIECEADVLDAIEGDGRFMVLWSEEIIEGEI